MSLKRIGLFAGAAVIALAIAVSAYTQESPGGPPMMGGPHMMMHGPGGPPFFMMLLKSANLTADQKTHVHQILGSDRAAMRAKFEQLHAIHEQIADKLLSTGQVSATDLTPLVQQAAAIQQQIDTQHLDTAIKIRALLTSDQLSKVAQTHQKLKGLFDQMRTLMGPPDAPETP